MPKRAAGPGIISMQLQVEQGKLGIGMLARDNVLYMLAEQAADISDAPIDVEVDISDVVNAGLLVFRSWTPNGTTTRARILSIETKLRDGLQQQILSEPGTILPLDSLSRRTEVPCPRVREAWSWRHRRSNGPMRQALRCRSSWLVPASCVCGCRWSKETSASASLRATMYHRCCPKMLPAPPTRHPASMWIYPT